MRPKQAAGPPRRSAGLRNGVDTVLVNIFFGVDKFVGEVQGSGRGRRARRRSEGG